MRRGDRSDCFLNSGISSVGEVTYFEWKWKDKGYLVEGLHKTTSYFLKSKKSFLTQSTPWNKVVLAL